MDLNDIGERIALFRKRKGMKQKELGKGIGMSGPMVSLIENGKRKVHSETIREIAAVLEIPPSELIGDVPVRGSEGKDPMLQMAEENEIAILSTSRLVEMAMLAVRARDVHGKEGGHPLFGEVLDSFEALLEIVEDQSDSMKGMSARIDALRQMFLEIYDRRRLPGG